MTLEKQKKYQSQLLHAHGDEGAKYINKAKEIGAIFMEMSDMAFKKSVETGLLESDKKDFEQLGNVMHVHYSKQLNVNGLESYKKYAAYAEDKLKDYPKFLAKLQVVINTPDEPLLKAAREVSEAWLHDHENALSEIEAAEKKVQQAQKELDELTK